MLTYCFTQDHSVAKSLAILIVTCPCALQLSRPLSLVALKRQAQRIGISILNLDRVLQWKFVNQVFLDKTGTLTLGRPELIREEIVSPTDSSDEVLHSLIYQLAIESSHPLSRALAESFSHRSKKSVQLEELQEKPGEGVSGIYDSKRIELSRPMNISSGMATSFKVDGQEKIRFYFEDCARPKITESLEELKVLGLDLVLLSGDHSDEVARFVSPYSKYFSAFHGDLKPEDKVNYQSKHSALVGDGLNDALAMKAAATSIGFSGSAEGNLQSADAYLVRRDLKCISSLVRAVRRANFVIGLNLSLSMVYNMLCIALVLYGFMGPVLCAIFMPVSSLTVILISSRARYFA